MDIKQFLNTVCKEIKYEPVKNKISEELELHIQELKDDYIKEGMEEKEAEQKAVSQMGVAEEIGKKLNKIHRPKLDWKLLVLILILMSFGLINAILRQPQMNDNYIGSTILYMSIGTILGIGIYFFDYKKIIKYSNLIYIIATVLMIMPILKMGYRINGVYVIRILGLTIFPATIALPLYLIAFVGLLVNHNKSNKINLNILDANLCVNKSTIKISTLAIGSLILLLCSSPVTNAVILGLLYLTIVTIKIIQEKENCIKKLIPIYTPILIMGILFVIALANSQLVPMRIVASFNPEIDPSGYGYSGMLQKDIINNAKPIGQADTYAITKEDESVIVKESNFTFIYLVGKLGIVASSLLVITIILTSLKIIFNAKSIKDQYGKYLVIGLGLLYILQSVASVLMNVNLGIFVGINLPFVAYGGVYFVVNVISISIILSVYRKKDVILYED